jgi:glyoxylase-like metal-dependent hydrolase (beta-lactamase superfamily II)
MKVYTTINPDTISNIYLLTDDNQQTGIIIDPGAFSQNVYKLVKYAGVDIKKIIITHNDNEQTGGIPLIQKIYDAEIYAYEDYVQDYKAIKIYDGAIIKEKDMEFKILETPVHSYDSISILVEDMLFIGDIFEAGTLSSITEGKNPCNYEYSIIKKKILSLPDNIIIYPGKGPATTVEIERKFNPYFKKINDIPSKN